MKSLLTILFLAITACTSSEIRQPAGDIDNASFFASRETYREAILNKYTRPSYEAALGKECVEGIVSLYKNSQNMSSKYVQDTSRSISEYSKKLTKGYPLYHYTDSEYLVKNFYPEVSDRNAVHERLRNNSGSFSYSTLLSYYRQAGIRGKNLWMQGWGNTENTVLYVASNPYTSTNYGKNLLTFWMSDATKVYPYALAMSNNFDTLIKADKKFKTFLNKCTSGVKLVIFEESGVDLVDYMSGIAPDAGWFYFISTKNIILDTVLIMKESGPTLQEEVDKDFIRVNSYLRNNGRSEEILK